jgi:hypothetical protein
MNERNRVAASSLSRGVVSGEGRAARRRSRVGPSRVHGVTPSSSWPTDTLEVRFSPWREGTRPSGARADARGPREEEAEELALSAIFVQEEDTMDSAVVANRKLST